MNSASHKTIRLASTDDIPEGEGREFRIGQRYVAIFRVNGHFYALEDMCPHAGAPLNNGPTRDCVVTCLWHGWRFDLRDGTCINHPKGRDVPVYPITVHGTDLYVTLPADDTVSP
jgi:nitrite reductase (NADH) small subunit